MRPPLGLLADALAIVVFAAAGRASHQEGSSLAGVLYTAWPFLLAAAVAWPVLRVWRGRWPTTPADGLFVWLGTLAGGMAARAVNGSGTHWSFVLVAALVLGVLLLGWRALVTRRGAPRPS